MTAKELRKKINKTKHTEMEVMVNFSYKGNCLVMPLDSTSIQRDDSFMFLNIGNIDQLIPDYKSKYEKCIEIIKRFDAGIIGMHDL